MMFSREEFWTKPKDKFYKKLRKFKELLKAFNISNIQKAQ